MTETNGQTPAPKFKRILLKLSGEALMGDDAFGINRATLASIVEDIKDVLSLGVELGIVVGGGNIFRGVALGATGMDRATGDYMGMLATVMNGMALQDALRNAGVKHACRVLWRWSRWLNPISAAERFAICRKAAS